MDASSWWDVHNLLSTSRPHHPFPLLSVFPLALYISLLTPWQRSTCHEHRAVNNQNQSHAHLDATGIGAIACARHGCFYPNSVVNFRKGEGYVICYSPCILLYTYLMFRQRYIDYAFVNAINYIPLLVIVLLLYDVMCQYWIHFLSRISGVSQYLSLPEGTQIKRGIGLFHVHGHVKECFARYAPTFIQGAGNVDGEVIETLWNPLNHTASSARSMSWFHRQEYLDTHMGDSNWKKLTSMGMLLTFCTR